VIFDANDVIIVPFPFTDRATTKRRPAVVLSNAAFNTATGHVIAAMITSAKQSAWSSDVAITDLAAAGLAVPCVVRMKLFTLEAGLVVRKAGRLAVPDNAAVRATFGGIVHG
jgi:mRNA interferase MazF